MAFHFLVFQQKICFEHRVIWLDRFQYMAIADNRQRYMPLPDDRLPGRCQSLAYPEAVQLVNPKIRELTGEVLIPQKFPHFQKCGAGSF